MPDAILSHVPGMKTASPVAVCNASELSESVFLGEFVATSQPCVIRGAVRHWAAAQKWRDRDHLKNLCGHRTIVYYPHENFIVEKRMEAGKRSMNFAEAMDILHSEETNVASLGFPDPLPELLQDIGGFSFSDHGSASHIV